MIDGIVKLLKARLGITTNIRDDYLKAIVESIIMELRDQQGIRLDLQNREHQLFIVDYASHRYDSVGKDIGMPRHLQYRLRCITVHDGGSDYAV